MSVAAAVEAMRGRDFTGEPYQDRRVCYKCGMFATFFHELKSAGVPVTLREYLTLMEAMDHDLASRRVEDFYYLSRAALIKDSGLAKRARMKNVCSHCHTGDYIDAFYKQYDDFIVLYNEKFAKPGQQIMKALRDQQLLTKTEFDEEIEWTWFYLWHHEGRRARHGVSMMAPDYTHWHGMYEVADRFYMKLIPQAREIVHQAESNGMEAQAKAVRNVLDGILSRPEHAWFDKEKRPTASKNKLR